MGPHERKLITVTRRSLPCFYYFFSPSSLSSTDSLQQPANYECLSGDIRTTALDSSWTFNFHPQLNCSHSFSVLKNQGFLQPIERRNDGANHVCRGPLPNKIEELTVLILLRGERIVHEASCASQRSGWTNSRDSLMTLDGFSSFRQRQQHRAVGEAAV